MMEIDTVFMLVRKQRGHKLALLYHRPGKTAREAWDYAIAEWEENFYGGATKEAVEESLRKDGWRAKRMRVFQIDP